MTYALVTAPFTPAAFAALVAEFGWEVLSSPGPGLLSGEGIDAAGVVALVVEAEPVDVQVLQRFPAVSVVGCVRGNPVNVDTAEATKRGVAVVASPGRNAESVADFVFGLALSVLRHIAHTHHLIVSRQLAEDREEVRRHKDVTWRPSDPAAPVPYRLYKGPELASLPLGLLGFGAIGSRVAKRANAFGMRVLAYDPFVPGSELAAAGVTQVGFDELFRQSDIVSLHSPAQEGRPLVGERELALMKPTGYLVNTARASVLDYDALVRALAGGRLAGAGLDVYPDEPLSSRSPLLDLTNVTLTPHLGGASTDVVEHRSQILAREPASSGGWVPEGGSLEEPRGRRFVAGGCPAGPGSRISGGYARRRAPAGDNAAAKDDRRLRLIANEEGQ